MSQQLSLEGRRLSDREVERLVKRARDLTDSMWSRLKRLPDYADFRAAFEDELRKDS